MRHGEGRPREGEAEVSSGQEIVDASAGIDVTFTEVGPV
jgi:hypothetical protein